jgi:hypothetical protein
MVVPYALATNFQNFLETGHGTVPSSFRNHFTDVLLSIPGHVQFLPKFLAEWTCKEEMHEVLICTIRA